MSEASNPAGDQADPPRPPATPTHFARIGGTPAVKAVVRRFYDQLLADPRLAGYFTAIDMQDQRRHMVLLLGTVLGGPDAYTGRSLTEAHQSLRIPDGHYRLVGEYLVATLTDLGVAADIVDDVRAVLARVREQVVWRDNRVDA